MFNVPYTAVKIIGYAATGVGLGASVVSNYVKDRKMEETIKEEVGKQVAKYMEEGSV